MQKVVGLVVLEGPDHSGKTTLCNYLCQKYDGISYHATYPHPGNIYDYHMSIVQKAVKQSNDKLVVLDRLWPSELVYGKIYRGKPAMPGYEILVDRVIRKHAGVYVFCLFDANTRINAKEYQNMFEAKAKTRGDLYVEKSTKTLQAYWKLYTKMICRRDVMAYLYRLEGDKLHEVARTLAARLRGLRHDQLVEALLPGTRNVVGHLGESRVLFIGDRVNAIGAEDKLYPFAAYRDSSLFFLQQLAKMRWTKDEDTMIVNVNDKHGILFCQELSKTLKTIALGTNAWQTCMVNGIRIDQYMQHPQWYNRFHHNDGQMLKDLNKIERKLFV